MTGDAVTIKLPQVVGKLGSDGEWRVLMLVPLQAPVWEADYELPLNADQAETLACQLLEYGMLVRDRRGLVPR